MKTFPGVFCMVLVFSLFSAHAQQTTSTSKSNYDRKGVNADVRVAYRVQKWGKQEVYFAVAARVNINAMGGYNYNGQVYKSEVPGLMDVLNKTGAEFPTVVFDVYYNSVKQGTKKFSIAADDDLGTLTGDGFAFNTSEAAAKNPGGWTLQAVSLESFNYHPDPTAWMAAEYAIKDYLKANEQRKKYDELLRQADAAFNAARTVEDLGKARALYHQALAFMPEESYPKQRIDQIDQKIKDLRDKEAQAKAAEEKKKAEEAERKRLEDERKKKEEEDRRIAEQKKADDKKKEEELEIAAADQAKQEALQKEQEEKEAEIKKAEEKAAAEKAEAERIQKEKDDADRREKEYAEKREKEKKEDDRAWNMKESIESLTESRLSREWEMAKAAWDANPPTGAEETKRYDQATAIMADARLVGIGADENSVIEAIHLYPYHPEVTRWIEDGGSKAGWDYLEADYSVRYKGLREYYQQSLSYADQQNMARGQIQFMSRQFSEMASLKHNFSNPQALIESVNRRMSLISQQRDQATQFHLDNLDAKLKKNETLNSATATQADRTVAAIGEGLTSAVDMINSASQAKRAREQLEYEKRTQMENIRDGLIEDTSNGIAELKSSLFNTDDQEAENAALNSYYNLTCYQEQVRTQFNYNSTGWYDNYCPNTSGDQHFKNLRPLNSSSQALNVASRKAQLYASTKIESFKEAALFRLGDVVKNNNDNAENLFYSYHIYQQLSSDEIEKIQYQFAKHAVFPDREEAQYLSAEKRLKEIIHNCIQKEDVKTFTAIVDKKLHRQIGQHFSDVNIPAMIKGDKSAILSLLLKNDKEFNTQQLKNGLLIESLVADASANTEVLVANGADINQKLADKNQKQVPLVLLFSEKKAETITHLVNRNTDFSAINVLLTDAKSKERFYGKMLQTAVTQDNIFAMKAVSAYSRPLLVKGANTNHQLFEDAVNNSSAKVLDSLFGYSTNDLDKNYLVFNSANLSVFNVLKRRGLDLNYKNNEGLTALHKAVENNNLAAVTNLVSAGADGAVHSTKGFSPVHLAVYNKNSMALEAMVKADKRTAAVKDKTYGWTPLHFAARENYLDGCRILIESGADKKAKDNWGRTPYKIAKERYFVSLKSVLK